MCMLDNRNDIDRGLQILLPAMHRCIRSFRGTFGDKWWNEVCCPSNLPSLCNSCTDDELVSSLDVSRCLSLLFKSRRYFQDSYNIGNWASELISCRNAVAHSTVTDMTQGDAERALDTMVRLCSALDQGDKECSALRELYASVRARAKDLNVNVYTGAPQPESVSKRGVLANGNLLDLIDTDIVQKTNQTRKITYDGKTESYPVYRVRCDQLYYNDQNDRIITWIAKEKREQGDDWFHKFNREEYNKRIEEFIWASNPEAMKKTKDDIKAFGQRVSGVTLADGRIVDGNRRFTCLRRLERNKQIDPPAYFETAIVDLDVCADEKQIKCLELAIQHGEEEKVSYDKVDYAIGTYKSVEGGVLTIEEYATNARETIADVNKRIEVAKIIVEFLQYWKLPERYDIARSHQVYSLFEEMLGCGFKKLDSLKQKQLKAIVFINAVMKAVPDQKDFIRRFIKKFVKYDQIDCFVDRSKEVIERIEKAIGSVGTLNDKDIDNFVKEHRDEVSELRNSMECALRSLSFDVNSVNEGKACDVVDKAIDSLSKCIDSRRFQFMGKDQQENLKNRLDYLSNMVDRFRSDLAESAGGKPES